jgi:phosphoribosylanthranilate isomerase
VQAVHPFAVDVASGVESAPGIKDPDKLTAFAAAVRGTAPAPEPTTPPRGTPVRPPAPQETTA